MNNSLQLKNHLLFINMVLQARLDIRNFFLKHAVAQIYENVGQILSLVRMQLALLDSEAKENVVTIDSTGELVGQSIRDLRTMCRSFYPDIEIMQEHGFKTGLESTIEILYPNQKAAITTKGSKTELHPELKLVVFTMLQQLLVNVKEIRGKYMSLQIIYSKEHACFTIAYKGKEISLESNSNDDKSFRLTLQEKVQLLEGSLNIVETKTGTLHIKLISPLKFPAV
jgi:signal transduction histidine kinase